MLPTHARAGQRYQDSSYFELIREYAWLNFYPNKLHYNDCMCCIDISTYKIAWLDQQLAAARAENEKIRQLIGEMGVSPQPTVAQWLQQKKLKA